MVKSGDITLDATDVGALETIAAGPGIGVTGNQVRVDEGSGLEFLVTN